MFSATKIRTDVTDDQRNNRNDIDSFEDRVWQTILSIVCFLAVLTTFPISLLFCVKVVKEYERVVVFRLGRLRCGTRGPGLFFIYPCIERYEKVKLRTLTCNVQHQKVLTKDMVSVDVDVVVHYHVFNATLSVTKVALPQQSTLFLAQTTLRNTLGRYNFSELLEHKEQISSSMQTVLDEITDCWGIKVERVDIKQVCLPETLQRSMAVEAEAAREAEAKVITAEGERKAATPLKEAGDELAQSPLAIQLRFLQTLSAVAANNNSTITFPVPIDLLSHIFSKRDKQSDSIVTVETLESL